MRVEVYSESEPMRVKIAKAQQQKVPYMLVVGDREAEEGNVGVRERTAGDIGAMPVGPLRRAGALREAVAAVASKSGGTALPLHGQDPQGPL